MIVRMALSMSRSRRNTPKVPITNAASEKANKVEVHRRTRHAAKITVQAAVHEGEDAEIAENEHPRSGGWRFAKDGKVWIGTGAPPTWTSGRTILRRRLQK
jgi:hypothetical protein